MPDNQNSKTINEAVTGFSWNTIGNFIRSFFGFAINIILARVLGPEPFGIVALAMLIIGAGNLIIDSGLGSALVQKKEITRNDISFVFTLQIGFSVLLTIVFILTAPWFAIQFNIPEAARVLRTMSLILILQAFAQVPASLLRRELNFKRLQFAQITSFFVGYVGFGLPMAWAGFGVWSLVTAQILQSGINAAIIYFFAKHSLILTIKDPQHLTIFGVRVLAANIANWIIQYLDQAIIGMKFGPQSLGFYSRAFFLNSAPAVIIYSSAQASLFSAVSRMGNVPETKHILQKFMMLFSIFFFPTYWLAALESSTIINILYGPEWRPAASLLTPLAIAIPFLILMGLQGPVLNGLGHPGEETKMQWITVVFAIIVLSFASNISLTIVAWSILVIYVFRFAMISYATVKIMKINWLDLLIPVGVGLSLGAATILTWSLSNFFSLENFKITTIAMLRISMVLFSWACIAWFNRNWLYNNLNFKFLLSAKE
jgi:lipopolysaccharide exporter